MSERWRCGVCEGVNLGGGTCAICGASSADAVPVHPPAAAEPLAATWDEPLPLDEPPPRRGFLARLADTVAGAVERALTVPPPPYEPPPDPDAEPAPRRRSRLRVRPFPFGMMVTWRRNADEDSR